MTNKYPNSGAISKNDRKTEDKHADISGSANIADVDYWVSGWQKHGDKGIFYSLSFTRKDAKPRSSVSSSQNLDDDIPF